MEHTALRVCFKKFGQSTVQDPQTPKKHWDEYKGIDNDMWIQVGNRSQKEWCGRSYDDREMRTKISSRRIGWSHPAGQQTQNEQTSKQQYVIERTN